MLKLYEGPTGDINTAFIHKVEELLACNSSNFKSPTSVNVALQASPIYNAIIRSSEIEREKKQQQQQKEEKEKQEEEKEKDHNIKKLEVSQSITNNALNSSSSSIVPLAITRRGLGPRDPLVQRKLRKQQQQKQIQQTSSLLLNSSGNSNIDKFKEEKEEKEEEKVTQQIVHWSRRPLYEMTSAGWDVFRKEVGIHIEVVARRLNDSQLQSQLQIKNTLQLQQHWGTSKNTSVMLRPIRCWEEAKLPLSLGTAVAKRYILPSPVQSQCIPLALANVSSSSSSGKLDILAVAETGSGKTAAYLIPLITYVLNSTPRLLENESMIAGGPLALIAVPTRELAAQVTREATLLAKETLSTTELHQLIQQEEEEENNNNKDSNTKLTRNRNTLDEIRVITIVGGEAMEMQYDLLSQGAHIVVGTLGQLEALLQQRLLALANTRLIVLDEADRMIEEQQRESLIAVLERCPLPRQTLMFTATLSPACEEVALKYFSPDGFIVVRVPHRCANIKQIFEVVPNDPGVISTKSTTNEEEIGGKNGRGKGEKKQELNQQQQQLERRRNPLLHPIKFARLVSYLVYANAPIVVFANEKRTCDALHDELRAEAVHLANLGESFSLEALVGELPPVLLNNNNNNNSTEEQRRRQVPGLLNLQSIAVVHSEQSQAERRRLVELFRKGERRVLITTDLLARGLDVPNITLVLNYDLPRVEIASTSSSYNNNNNNNNNNNKAGEEAVQKYIHRIGRTGRAGASGIAISLVCISSLLIQRAEQHVQRGAGVKQEEQFLQRLQLTGTSEKAKIYEMDRRELTGSRDNKDKDEDLMLMDNDNDDNNDDYDDDDDNIGEDGVNGGPPRQRQRIEGKLNNKQNYKEEDEDDNEEKEKKNNTPKIFPNDELLLQPLWNFLVSCAEANSNSFSGRGGELIKQDKCRHVKLPPSLAALMIAFTQRSPYGTITS